jgi:hypothetical protein
MQLPSNTLSTLVASFIAMAVLTSQIMAAPPKDLTTSTCKAACVVSHTESCKQFNSWNQVAQAKLTSSKGTLVKGALYNKIEWHFAPQGSRKSWFGGHIAEDGSMSQWAIGPGEKGKRHVIKYISYDFVAYFWINGEDLCTAPAKEYQRYDSLMYVAVLTPM